MSFEALVSTMDDTLVRSFQRVDPTAGVQQLTVQSADGSAATVPCIVEIPPMEEDFTPGSPQGTKMLMLFIPPSAGVVALMGDIAIYNGVRYDVVQSNADRCAGVHIRLRERTQ